MLENVGKKNKTKLKEEEEEEGALPLFIKRRQIQLAWRRPCDPVNLLGCVEPSAAPANISFLSAATATDKIGPRYSAELQSQTLQLPPRL